MKTRSIRRSLLVRCGTGVGGLLCLLSAAIYLLVENSSFQEMDDSLKETATLLSNQVELENGGIIHEWREGLGSNHAVDTGLYQFWDESSGITTRSPGLEQNDLPRFSGVGGAPLLRTVMLPGGKRGRALGMRVYPFVLPEEMRRMEENGKIIDPKSLPHVLVVARDAEPVHRTLDRLRWILGIGTLCALGGGYVLIHQAVRASLKPLDQLAREVRGRTEQRLDAALEVPGELPSELSGLAGDFDSLLARVAAIRQRERDFIRHAAHELRTPIAGLRATTDLALSQPRDAASYLNSLETCRKSAEDLGTLVQRLSALARIGSAPETGEPVSIDIRSFVMECGESFTRMASDRHMEISYGMGNSPVRVSADPVFLGIILNNLFDNAVCYASDGPLKITVREGSRVEVVFANRIVHAPADPNRWFEAMYRGNTSRHDAGSHLGVGLTLSLEAARAMGGNLSARQGGEGWIELVLTLENLPPPA